MPVCSLNQLGGKALFGSISLHLYFLHLLCIPFNLLYSAIQVFFFLDNCIYRTNNQPIRYMDGANAYIAMTPQQIKL